MKIKITIIPTIFFLFIISIFFYLLVIDRNPSNIPSVLLNNKAPNFESKTVLTKKKFMFYEELGKKIVLVNFFASWCKPCRDEHQYIENFSRQKKIKVIGVNYKDNDEKSISWLNDVGNPYSKIAIDKKGRIAIDWGVYGIPETFIIDTNGIVKYRHAGPITENAYKKINFIINSIKQ